MARSSASSLPAGSMRTKTLKVVCRYDDSGSIGGIMTAMLTRRELMIAAASLSSLRAAGSSMKLSITVRIAEAPGSNQKTIMGFDEVIGIAKKIGYDAVDMRASQGGIQTPK